MKNCEPLVFGPLFAICWAESSISIPPPPFHDSAPSILTARIPAPVKRSSGLCVRCGRSVSRATGLPVWKRGGSQSRPRIGRRRCSCLLVQYPGDEMVMSATGRKAARKGGDRTHCRVASLDHEIGDDPVKDRSCGRGEARPADHQLEGKDASQSAPGGTDRCSSRGWRVR